MGPGNLRCDDVILFVGAHNESCALSLMFALPVNSRCSMEAFANARLLQTAESAQETRDPKSYPSCALALLISREMQRALIQGDTRNPCRLFAYRIDRWWPKFHYACPKFELMITCGTGHYELVARIFQTLDCTECALCGRSSSRSDGNFSEH